MRSSSSISMSSTLRVQPGLRVLQVIDADPMAYPPTINAARVLAGSGAHVRCIGGMRGQRPLLAMPDRVSVEYLVYGSWEKGLRKLHWAAGRFRFRAQIAQIVRDWQPHLVIAYDTGAGWAVLPLLGRTRTVLHIHDNENANAQSWRSVRTWQWHSLKRRAVEFTMRVVPDAERAAHLRDEWGVQGAFQVVGNVPPRRAPVRNHVLRDLLEIPDASPLAVVVGNMGLFSATAKALARTRLPWHLAVIGAGDQTAVVRMRQVAAEAGVASRIHVFSHTSYDVVRTWLLGCDVGLALHPSDSRTINWQRIGTGSVKVMEYTAAGLPSIVCSRAAFSQLAAQSGALEVIDREDEEGIAAALDRLEPGSQPWQERAQAAVEAHLGRYNMEAQLSPLLQSLGVLAE
jgi:hypothetical protein